MQQIDARSLGFEMTMGGVWTDEVLASASPGTAFCVDVQGITTGAQILAGANRTPVNTPFDPVSLQTCVPVGNECGNPLIDPAVDAGLFVWKSCSGSWNLMITGDATLGGVSYSGSISSTGGFDAVTDVSLEASDLLTNTGTTLTFDLTTGHPWQDQFEYQVPTGSEQCVTITELPATVGVFAGVDRTPVGLSFNPETLATCN